MILSARESADKIRLTALPKSSSGAAFCLRVQRASRAPKHAGIITSSMIKSGRNLSASGCGWVRDGRADTDLIAEPLLERWLALNLEPATRLSRYYLLV